MNTSTLEELIKKYQEEKKLLANQITLSIEYNRLIDKQKINMVELNNKMYKLNRTIEQTNELIKREKNKETETQNDTKEQLLSKLSQAVKIVKSLEMNNVKEKY